MTVKYIDPSYMVRSVPADAGDSYLCMLLAHAAAHGAMAGYTGFTVGLVKNKSVMIPIPELARSRRPAVLRCLQFIQTTRGHLTMTWVVSFLISRPFGPRPRCSAQARTSPRSMNARGRTWERVVAVTNQPCAVARKEVAWAAGQHRQMTTTDRASER